MAGEATRPLVVERDGSLIGRGGEVAEDDMIFEGASAFVGDDVVYVRLEQGSEVAEVVPDGAVLAVATVDAVRSGDAVWTDDAIEGAGPIIDRHRRVRWTSATTVTMVADEAVDTIDVGTE